MRRNAVLSICCLLLIIGCDSDSNGTEETEGNFSADDLGVVVVESIQDRALFFTVTLTNKGTYDMEASGVSFKVFEDNTVIYSNLGVAFPRVLKPGESAIEQTSTDAISSLNDYDCYTYITVFVVSGTFTEVKKEYPGTCQ